jgi:alcohol dehydrogenase
MNWHNSFSLRLPTEITFGLGVSQQVGAKAHALGASRALILTDKGVANTGRIEHFVEVLADSDVQAEVFDTVDPEPSITTVERAWQAYEKFTPQVLIAIGGGSSIDTAKATATLATNGGKILDYMSGTPVNVPLLPVIALPTTAGTGSEVSNSAVITNPETDFKGGIGGPLVLARIALVDPELTFTTPPRVTANTGMDVLVHAIECYLNPAHQPFSDGLALRAIHLVGSYLRAAYANGKDVEARCNMAYASMTAGMAFSNKGLGDVHALAGPLATHLKQPHGVTVTVLLPHLMEFNLIARVGRMVDIAEALGEETRGLSPRAAAERAVVAVRQLMQDLNMQFTLREMGATREILPTLITGGINRGDRSRAPRPMTADDISALFEEVF